MTAVRMKEATYLELRNMHAHAHDDTYIHYSEVQKGIIPCARAHTYTRACTQHFDTLGHVRL